MPLSDTQIAALETAGREVAEGWLRQGDLEPTPDYDFAAIGDWEHVRAAAIAAGVDWDADDLQPASEIAADVWSAATRGYRAALAEVQ